MSDYLIHELERYGVAVRDRSEIAELHGDDGQLEAVTLRDGERVPLSFLFLFLGASPCTEWLGDVVGPRRARVRADRGRRRRRGPAGDQRARGSSPPATSAPGSVKRCATAVGEGAMVVRFVHERMSGVPA